MSELTQDPEFWRCARTDLHPTRAAVAAHREDADADGRSFAEDIFFGEQIGPREPDRYAEYLQSEHWAEYRRGVLTRQGGVCATCMNDATHCHHRSYARCGIERDEDCVGLCADCHRALHAGRKAARREQRKPL